MAYRRSLRFRVGLAFTLLGAILAAVFAGATWITSERMEQAFLQVTLVEELEYFVAEWRRDPSTRPPDTHSIRGYVAPLGDLGRVPEYLRGLGPGTGAAFPEGRELEVAVRDEAGHRFYLVYNEDHIEAAEAELLRLLGVSAALAIGLSLWLGWLAGGRVTAPAQALARRVDGLDPRDLDTSLAADFQGDDEVHALARAFDRTFRRVGDFVERERSFTADASHQLRTSAAVVSSTVELLLEDPGLPTASRERLERLARAAEQLNRQIESFLFLAREPAPNGEPPVSVAETLRRIVDDEREDGLSNDRSIELRVVEDLHVPAPAAAFDIVLGNLLRNALVHGSGPVIVEVTDDGVTVHDEGSAVSDETLRRAFERGYRGNPHRPGDGLGLAIARRVCEGYGWTVEMERGAGVGTVCRVRMRRT